MEWWERVCQYRCEKNESEGFYVDQRYLDLLPIHFENVHVIDHKGCNVAEWSLEHLPRVIMPDGVYICNQPLIFIHFTQITIDRIEKGFDPMLAPCLERYRQYAADAERTIIKEGLDLYGEDWSDDRDCSAVISPDVADHLVLCAVVDFSTAPNLLLMLESLRQSCSSAPDVHLLCADLESFQFLNSLACEALHLYHWSSLDSYRLYKLRQAYEGQTFHEGDQRRFTESCKPFFLNHLLFNGGFGQIVQLDAKLIFTQAGSIDFSVLKGIQDCLLLPVNRQHFAALCVARNQQAALLIKIWENGVSKHGPTLPDTYDSQLLSNVDGIVWKRFDYLLQRTDLRYGSSGGQSGNKKQGSVPAVGMVPYDDATLVIKDWELIIPSTSPLRDNDEIVADLGRLMARIMKLHHLPPSWMSVDACFDRLPISEIIQIAAKRGIDVGNVAVHFKEKWHGALSRGMKAYLLYLLAVAYKDAGHVEEAGELFSCLDDSPVLISDLYRGKTAFHLAELAEQDHRQYDAQAFYRKCLEFTAYRRDARQRLKALETIGRPDRTPLRMR